MLYVYIDKLACVCVCALVVEDRSLLWMIFLQMVSTEWFLGVQIQNFENLYNVIIAQGYYCCCDFFVCSENITDLQEICMNHLCQPYFLIHIRDSSCNGTCSLNKTYQLNYEPSTSILDHAVLSIPFKEMEWSDHVRIKIS